MNVFLVSINGGEWGEIFFSESGEKLEFSFEPQEDDKIVDGWSQLMFRVGNQTVEMKYVKRPPEDNTAPNSADVLGDENVLKEHRISNIGS